MRAKLQTVVGSPLVYTLLFAAYPVIFLWGHNRGSDVATASALVVLLLMLAGSLLLFGLFFLMFRNPSRAAIATTIIVVLFSSFGHLEDILQVGGGTLEEAGLFVAWLL